MKKRINVKDFGPWAIITGASSGIGKEFALQLSQKGINLVLVARRLNVIEELGKSLNERFGIEYRCIQLDLSQPDGFQKIIDNTLEIDIGLLISNAGTGRPGRLIERDSTDLSEIIHLNGLSHFWLAHYYAKVFAKRCRGGIFITGAMGATGGVPYMAAESGTKAFVEGFGKALNWELMGKGVHVTVLITPPTDTKVLGELGFKSVEMRSMPIVPVQQCVKESIKALEQNQASIIPGRFFRVMNTLVPEKMSRNKMGNILKLNNNIL
ncbi:MAG: SDR family NAD(P)-dependent oxidoreductase [Chloroflexia bacterium]|nr:SDR family NAD(P)-dependent oxidoreductase [Chloroflexia bacterium]